MRKAQMTQIGDYSYDIPEGLFKSKDYEFNKEFNLENIDNKVICLQMIICQKELLCSPKFYYNIRLGQDCYPGLIPDKFQDKKQLGMFGLNEGFFINSEQIITFEFLTSCQDLVKEKFQLVYALVPIMIISRFRRNL